MHHAPSQVIPQRLLPPLNQLLTDGQRAAADSVAGDTDGRCNGSAAMLHGDACQTLRAKLTNIPF